MSNRTKRDINIPPPTLESFYKPAPTTRQAERISIRAALMPEFSIEPTDRTLADIAAHMLGVPRVAVGRWIDDTGRELYWVARSFRGSHWIDDCRKQIPVWRVVSIAGTIDGLLAGVEKVAVRRELLLRRFAA